MQVWVEVDAYEKRNTKSSMSTKERIRILSNPKFPTLLHHFSNCRIWCSFSIAVDKDCEKKLRIVSELID